MNNYDYQSLVQEICSMPLWKVIALGAVAAEKVMPIIQCRALPATRDFAEQSLACAWSSITELGSRKEESIHLLETLEKTSEWQEEPGTYFLDRVADALQFYKWVLEAVKNASNTQQVGDGGFSYMLDVAAGVDLAQEDVPGELEKANKGIRVAEKRSQQLLVDLLKKEERPSSALIDALHQEANKISSLFANALACNC